jgi:hypothetical protein
MHRPQAKSVAAAPFTPPPIASKESAHPTTRLAPPDYL